LLKLNIAYLDALKKLHREEASSEKEKQQAYDDLADSMKKIADGSKEQNKANADLGSSTKSLDDKLGSVKDRYQQVIDKQRERTFAPGAPTPGVAGGPYEGTAPSGYPKNVEYIGPEKTPWGEEGYGGGPSSGEYPAKPGGPYRIYQSPGYQFNLPGIDETKARGIQAEAEKRSHDIEDYVNQQAQEAGEKAAGGRRLGVALDPRFEKAFHAKWDELFGARATPGGMQYDPGKLSEQWRELQDVAHFRRTNQQLGNIMADMGMQVPFAPRPGQPAFGAEKPKDQAKGDGGATESTLQKVQQTLEKVFTGSGG